MFRNNRITTITCLALLAFATAINAQTKASTNADRRQQALKESVE